MKRKGIKIASLILTIISGVSILLTYFCTGFIYYTIDSLPKDDEMYGAGILFILAIIFFFYIFFVVFELAVTAIVLNAIDMKKSKREEKQYTRTKVFLILNIVYAVLCSAYPIVLHLLSRFL